MSSTRDPDAKPARLYDVRTIERNIKKGLVSRKDYDKYLKSLDDAATKIAPAEEILAADDDDDGDDEFEDTDTTAPNQEAPPPVEPT